MELRNIDMFQMINSLNDLLDRKDLIGYAAARNTRLLTNECAEFIKRRDELIQEYGEPVRDENGNTTGDMKVSMTSPCFSKFVDELEKFGEIKHEVNIFTIPESEVIGSLSGREILELEWMLTSDSEKE